MLSYQHAYHAGNMADVHKHAVLARVLNYMARKDKPLSYMETHAGRGLYHLNAPEALKTAEAAFGINIALAKQWFAPDHPYMIALQQVRREYGADAYPGSPLVAAQCLRPTDIIRLCELHPQEFAALDDVIGLRASCRQADGLQTALSLCPPDPRRGVLLIDPSYEVKTEYAQVAKTVLHIHKKWNTGVILIWYPVLANAAHRTMVRTLSHQINNAMLHEVRFPPARETHRMVGSGLFIINPPYGLDSETAALSRRFQA